MNDLISRQTLKNALTNWQMEYAEKSKDVERFETLGAVIDLVEQIPTAEPKKGKWIKDDVGVHCSECFCGWDFLTGIPVEVYGFHYCPNCGAPMERGE